MTHNQLNSTENNLIWFEDIEVGKVSTIGTYTVSENEIAQFARQWDPQPLHLDNEAARAAGFDRITAPATLVFCIISSLFNSLEPIAIICGLKNEFTMRLAVYGDDTLSLSIHCNEKRFSKTKTDRGIAQFVYQLKRQDGGVVTEGSVSFMIKRRNS